MAAALASRGLPPTIIFTGQHPGLDPADHGLGGYAAVRLDCPGQQDPHAHVGNVGRAVAATLATRKCDLVVVQGDTSSALGGALGSKLAKVAVAHVEAGLRSHDPRNPWPEEEFRIAIDRESDLLLAATELSAANLRRERVSGAVHVTGNTVVDSVLAIPAPAAKIPPGGLPRLLVTCHRRENWGDGLAAIAAALRQISAAELARVEVILHPNPFVAGQMRATLSDEPNVGFRDPCTHPEAIAAMLQADLVLSDSGGIQEEATTLGIPLLVLRRTTERPEAIATGNVELVGTETDRIVRAVRRRLARKASVPASRPFGDGRAGERIAAIIEEWLDDRLELSPAMTDCPRQSYGW